MAARRFPSLYRNARLLPWSLRPALSPGTVSSGLFTEPTGPRAITMVKILVLGCVLAAVAITLKVRLETPQGPQPLARAILSTHLQQLQGELALP